MNQLDSSISFYSNYFKGIQDVAQHKAIKQTGLGLLKIASYPTLIIPIIFGVGYLIAKSKMNQLSSLIDRVTKSLEPSFSGSTPTQNEYITFLASKILDGEYEQIAHAFEKLRPDSKSTFFALMGGKEKIQEAIDPIPKKLNEIYLRSAPWNNLCHIWRVMELDSEQKIVIDLSIIDFSQSVEEQLFSLLGLNSNHNNVHLNRDMDETAIFAASSFEDLIAHLKSKVSLKIIEIFFEDHFVTLKKDENSLIYIDRIVGLRRNVLYPIRYMI